MLVPEYQPQGEAQHPQLDLSASYDHMGKQGPVGPGLWPAPRNIMSAVGHTGLNTPGRRIQPPRRKTQIKYSTTNERR